MIRPALIAAAIIALSGCAAPMPASAPGDAATPPAAGLAAPAPVEVMDPGAISCSSIATAPDGRHIDAATPWAVGQLRAAVMRGALPGPAPRDSYDAGVASFISDYCRTATGATVRDAVNAMVAG